MSFCSTLYPTDLKSCGRGRAITACPCIPPSPPAVAIQLESAGQTVTGDFLIEFPIIALLHPPSAFSPSGFGIAVTNAGIYRITYTASVVPFDGATTAVTLRVIVFDADSNVVYFNDQTSGPNGMISDNIIFALQPGYSVAISAIRTGITGFYTILPGAVFNIQRIGQ